MTDQRAPSFHNQDRRIGDEERSHDAFFVTKGHCHTGCLPCGREPWLRQRVQLPHYGCRSAAASLLYCSKWPSSRACSSGSGQAVHWGSSIFIHGGIRSSLSTGPLILGL